MPSLIPISAHQFQPLHRLSLTQPFLTPPRAPHSPNKHLSPALFSFSPTHQTTFIVPFISLTELAAYSIIIRPSPTTNALLALEGHQLIQNDRLY